MEYSADRIVVRGGGDLATGVIQKLWRAGFKVAVLEVAKPLAIRRSVALCEAVRHGEAHVEDMRAYKVGSPQECPGVWECGHIPILVDPEAASLKILQPVAVVDAILAKRNIGTHGGIAPITVALGPGFSAPDEVDAVIETMRGHNLGRLILSGAAMPNTGVPGEVGGKSAERVVHAPAAGIVRHVRSIGDAVLKGEILFYVGDAPVPSPLDGILRGLIAEGLTICKGLKSADVDPRPASDVDWRSISDKARNLGGAVLEACLYVARRKGIRLTI